MRTFPPHPPGFWIYRDYLPFESKFRVVLMRISDSQIIHTWRNMPRDFCPNQKQIDSLIGEKL